MKVEVDTNEITALEQQVQQMASWLTIAIGKRKDKTLTITPEDLQAAEGATVQFEQDETGIVLRYKAP